MNHLRIVPNNFVNFTASCVESQLNSTIISKQSCLESCGDVVKKLVHQLSPEAEKAFANVLTTEGVPSHSNVNLAVNLIQKSVVEKELIQDGVENGRNFDQTWLKEDNTLKIKAQNTLDEWNMSL